MNLSARQTTKRITAAVAILFLFSCLFTQAQTRDSIVIIRHQQTSTICHDTTVTTYDTTIVKVPVPSGDGIFRAVYINSIDQITGNAAKENALISDLNKYKFNHTYAYGVTSTSAMAALNKRIRKETKCNDIGATAGSLSTFLGSRTTFNKAQPDSSDFNNWNLEFEAYNQADIATAWSTNVGYLKGMQAGKAAAKVKDAVQYFGWWTKSPMNIQTPDTLVKYTDYIILHEYTATPSWSYMRGRCNDINAAGKRQGKIPVVRVLFSAEPAFMQPWLKAGHTLDEAYKIIKAGFDAEHYTNLKIDGYIVFHIDFLRASQPATGLRTSTKVYSDSKFINITTTDHLKMATLPDEQ